MADVVHSERRRADSKHKLPIAGKFTIKVLAASEEVRAELRRRANGRSTEHRDRFRAEIILLRLDGMKIEDVAAHMNTSMRTVSIWSSRFEKAGLDGLADKRWPGP